MAIRRVFVIWTHTLVMVSLRAILEHAQIEWVGDSSTLAFIRNDALLNLLDQQKPNIILIEGQPDENTTRALQLIKNSKSNLRVIGLNLEGNEIQLYETEQGLINQTQDLLDLILKE